MAIFFSVFAINSCMTANRADPQNDYRLGCAFASKTKGQKNAPGVHAPSIKPRRNAAFRRKTNTYAKTQWDLQRTLDLHWLIHNFVRGHFTTQKVPAVAIGILEIGLAWPQLFSVRYAA